MKILFINASPRKTGFSTQVLKEIYNRINSAYETIWFDINNLNIRPCQGCLQCRPNKECILPKDDGHRIAKSIKNADVLILGSPTYFGNITGPLRTLIDRSLTAFEEIDASGLEIPTPLHTGKKAVIVTACNMPFPGSELPNHGAGALFAMETTINAGGYDLVGKIMVDGAASCKHLPNHIKEKAYEIASRL